MGSAIRWFQMEVLVPSPSNASMEARAPSASVSPPPPRRVNPIKSAFEGHGKDSGVY